MMSSGDATFADFRSERYRRRCRDVLDSHANEKVVDVENSLSFDDCFEMCAGTPPDESLPSSAESSRSSSPSTADDDEEEEEDSASGMGMGMGMSPKRERALRRRRSRSRGSSRGSDRGVAAGSRCQHATSCAATPSTTHKNSPVSVLDVAAHTADALSSKSLDELIAFQSSNPPPADACPRKALDFSFFDSFAPRSNVDRHLGPAIAAVMKDGEVATEDVEALQRLLQDARLATSRGLAPSCELNAVNYNRLVTRLTELGHLHTAAELLDMMASDGVSFTTVHDDWVLRGSLNPAVGVLRRLMTATAFGDCSPQSATLDAILLAWLEMGPAGLHAAVALNDLLCDQGCQLTVKRAEDMVQAVVGHSACGQVDREPAVRALEQMLERIFLAPNVHFEVGALAALVHALEGGTRKLEATFAERRNLCEVVRRLCAEVPSRQPCIRSLGSFLRLMLKERRFDDAVALLASLQPQVSQQEQHATPVVDTMFLTSVLHAVAAAVPTAAAASAAATPDHESVEEVSAAAAAAAAADDDNDDHALANLVTAAQALCALAASAPRTVCITYSVLNQTLNTLRDGRLQPRAAADVAVALFDGLRQLHSKAVNRRSFDRVFDLLLRAHSDGLAATTLEALRRVHDAAADGGYAVAPETAEKLVALGVRSVSSEAGVHLGRRERSSTTAPIDIESMMPRSSSNDKLYCAAAAGSSGGSGSRSGSVTASAPRARIAFELCNH